jgi:hypothetical protein
MRGQVYADLLRPPVPANKPASGSPPINLGKHFENNQTHQETDWIKVYVSDSPLVVPTRTLKELLPSCQSRLMGQRRKSGQKHWQSEAFRPIQITLCLTPVLRTQRKIMDTPLPHLRTLVNPDGAAILDAKLGTITTLNPTGAYIWNALQRGEETLKIAEGLSRETGEPLEHVRSELDLFLVGLRDRGLVLSELGRYE